MRVKITNWKKIGASFLIIGAVFALLSLQTKAASQSDAIAVRIMPNINHDSIETWYANQGFKGSPQSLIVDGYEAIRDGRTVFVNAANLDSVGKKIYTNIYLISYNQESETKTLDILGQLVSHWKFNNNISDSGTCSISTISCQADTDCPNDYLCSNSFVTKSDHVVFSKGKCVLKTDKICNIDSDCPVNLFCDSLKARVIRDTKRLGQFNKITSALESFKNNNGSYPALQSGTYVPGASISVWPSWKETLFAQLGLGESIQDPINSLGYCEGYEAATCWDNVKKSFVNANLVLPGGSQSFIYRAFQNGVSYSLCSVFETRDLGYDTTDKIMSSNYCAINNTYYNSNTNAAPLVESLSLTVKTKKELNGYIKAFDPENDLISWNLELISPKDWLAAGWPSGTNSFPVIQDSGVVNQKRIYAPKAGKPGSYDMLLTLSDSRGAATTTKVSINVEAPTPPKIEAGDLNYFLDPVIPLQYTFYLEGEDSVPTYSVRALNSDPISVAINEYLKTNLTSVSVGLNRIKVDLSFLVPTSLVTSQDITLPLRISATADEVSSTKDINFNLKIEQPYLDFQCENMARLGWAYPISGSACLLGKNKNGNHSLTYKLLSGTSGLQIGQAGDDSYLFAPIIPEKTPSLKEVKISVTNEYGASAVKSFNLQTNTFCGDGIKQKPNSEGRGGLYNNGVESCDGYDGVWSSTSTVSHSSEIQYACTSGLNIKTPYPILDNNNCVFKAADQGGGYCGDGICQSQVINADGNPTTMETCDNCSEDCGKCLCTPQCDGKICGDDGCGGTCGSGCNAGESCVGGSCCSTSADVQVCVDNHHQTFFNGSQVSTTINTGCGTACAGVNDATQGCCWKAIQKFPVSVLSGNNVFAIKGVDLGGQFGISATLNLSGCRSGSGTSNSFSMTTDSLDKWKCTNTLYDNWTSISFDDSSWPNAKSTGNKGPSAGNALPYDQIWASNAWSTNTTVYCRYVFSSLTSTNNNSCTPSCAGKCGGPDGCGGFCPDNCVGSETCGGGGVQYVCGSEDVFTCVPKCNGKCGGPDGCGSLCEDTCEPNFYCVAPNYNSCLTSTNNNSCTPSCAGKCGGPDGCGGFCPDNCIGSETCGGGGVQYVCGSEDVFTCVPKCNGKCGGPDGCGSLCEDTCEPNFYCVAPNYTFCKFLKPTVTPNDPDYPLY